ncbi:hypothetical protein DM02DRAFT_614642 [Periconia macrospinosa]|uniref:Uncharacterized protein n=1 Tax=Periconia macrospinosa TaxID=97972 RepID=A0A2V1DS63_9PLEO|nr:hypothetical protein DM02DRAFT_614642 [Periconia macrospinosa]
MEANCTPSSSMYADTGPYETAGSPPRKRTKTDAKADTKPTLYVDCQPQLMQSFGSPHWPSPGFTFSPFAHEQRGALQWPAWPGETLQQSEGIDPQLLGIKASATSSYTRTAQGQVISASSVVEMWRPTEAPVGQNAEPTATEINTDQLERDMIAVGDMLKRQIAAMVEMLKHQEAAFDSLLEKCRSESQGRHGEMELRKRLR